MKNPTQIIILGGTGDLSRRKLFPALLDLYARGMLPNNFRILGLGRSVKNKKDYIKFISESIKEHHINHNHSKEILSEFCNKISFVCGDLNDQASYENLLSEIENYDTEQGIRSNRLMYLAIPPKIFSEAFVNLKESKIADDTENAWAHILVEKPFGSDLDTAKKLDVQLSSLFREDQIFRIDHYLAKEAVQNILSFRFSNNIIKTPWNNESVESVHIKMTETVDIGTRAGFYEGIGALRDVGQNHLLQLLALVAMKEPETFTVEAIREERVKVLESLKPISEATFEKSVLRAQYEGYSSNDDIPDDSQTETYFELKAELDIPEWKGVPFFVQAGKALDESEVSITIKLKDVAEGLFETDSCLTVGNQIKLTISPEQVIAITINAKSPGLGYNLETRTLSFTRPKEKNEIKNSYEKVLFDSITGDQTLFTRTESVLAAWKFITPIIENWDKLPLHTYKKGSAGPTESILKNK